MQHISVRQHWDQKLNTAWTELIGATQVPQLSLIAWGEKVHTTSEPEFQQGRKGIIIIYTLGAVWEIWEKMGYPFKSLFLQGPIVFLLLLFFFTTENLTGYVAKDLLCHFLCLIWVENLQHFFLHSFHHIFSLCHAQEGLRVILIQMQLMHIDLILFMHGCPHEDIAVMSQSPKNQYQLIYLNPLLGKAVSGALQWSVSSFIQIWHLVTDSLRVLFCSVYFWFINWIRAGVLNII